MTITYMFRAKSRQDHALPEGDSCMAQGTSMPEPPLVLTLPSQIPAHDTQAARPLDHGPATPSPLHSRLNGPVQADSIAAASTDKVISPALPAPAGPISRYVPTDNRIILVAKARGGIGATTLAVNLAVEMQQQASRRSGAVGGRVALVDLDVQLGNAGSLLDLADRGGMLALARLGPEPDAQAVQHAMVSHSSGLSVLVAPATAIPFEAFDIRRITSILDALAAAHDVVIVDLPPALIDWLEPLLARAERLLIVTDLAVPSIARARRILKLMTEDRPELPVEIVVAHEKKPFRLGQTHRDAAAALGHALYHWLPDEAKLARQALDRGEPLVQLAPRCGWSKAMKLMAADLQTRTRSGTNATPRGDH